LGWTIDCYRTVIANGMAERNLACRRKLLNWQRRRLRLHLRYLGCRWTRGFLNLAALGVGTILAFFAPEVDLVPVSDVAASSHVLLIMAGDMLPPAAVITANEVVGVLQVPSVLLAHFTLEFPRVLSTAGCSWGLDGRLLFVARRLDLLAITTTFSSLPLALRLFTFVGVGLCAVGNGLFPSCDAFLALF
jgi:hypothetical protein